MHVCFVNRLYKKNPPKHKKKRQGMIIRKIPIRCFGGCSFLRLDDEERFVTRFFVCFFFALVDPAMSLSLWLPSTLHEHDPLEYRR